MRNSMCILAAVLALSAAGTVRAASSTNEYIGVSRLLTAANQWSPASAPTAGGNIRDWLIGGSGFQVFTSGTDLTVNTATGTNRVYADTVFIAAGVNSLSNDLGFTVGGSADNRIVVKTGFDIASGVTNNVVLKSTKWASSNANNVITFNHAGTGILKIQNDWVETPGIAMVYNGTASNRVEFGSASSTYTGGTTLNNVSAKLMTNNAVGAASGNIVLTNGALLDMGAFTVSNKVVAAAGSGVKTVMTSAKTRTGAIEAQGDMLLLNNSGTVTWNGDITIDSGAQLEVNNAASAVTQLGGTLSGNGTLLTSSNGTTVFNSSLNSSGFSGETVGGGGILQFRGDNLFGTGGITLLSGANFRGFVSSAGDLDLSLNNAVSIQGDSRIAVTAGSGLSGNNSSVTLGGDITFTQNATLSLEAGGNADNYAAGNTLNINGVIKEAAGKTGSVVIDNHWTTSYYTNSITKFSAANTYHGKTDIQFGRLQLVGDGSIDNSSNLHVQAQGVFDVSTRNGGAYTYGGTVDGTGLIVGDLTLTGNVNPGNSPGTLTFDGALTLADGSVTTMEITDIAHDILMGNGVDTLTADGTVIFDFTGFTGGVTNGYTIALADLFSNWGSVVSTGATYSALGLSGSQSLDFTGGNLTVIPEPATIGMLLLGGASVVMLRRMTRRK